MHWAYVPETYSITSLACNSPGNLLPNTSRDPALLLPRRHCPTPTGQTTYMATSQPSHPLLILCTLHLQILSTIVTASHGEGGFAPGMQCVIECIARRGRCGPRDNCPSRAPHHLFVSGVQGLIHLSPEGRTVPTRVPGSLHTAHWAIPQMVHTP